MHLNNFFDLPLQNRFGAAAQGTTSEYFVNIMQQIRQAAGCKLQAYLELRRDFSGAGHCSTAMTILTSIRQHQKS